MPRPEDNPPSPPPDQAPEPGTSLAPDPARSEGRVEVRESRPPQPGRPANPDSTIDQGRPSSGPLGGAPNALVRAQRFGDYEVQELVGRGGMGEVWTARHYLLEVIDALKVISRGHSASKELRARFLTEMQALVKLEHDNIVAIRTAGEVDGELYFSMAYEGGGDLAKLLEKEGALEPRRAANLVRQVAAGVAYAHGKDIIHCDLKPHNVLLSAEGTPKVTDFGLALLLAGGEDGRAGTGEPVGTPSYMPPEQANGRCGRLSDVYGLGAVLYELLTGHPPFRGSVAEVLRQVKTDRPRRPRDLNPAVPRRLEAVCLKCLEKDPGRRYPTADHVARALHGYLRPWWRRTWRELVVGAAFVLLSGVLVWAGLEMKYEAPRREARHAKDVADGARELGHRDDALIHYGVALDRYTDLLGSDFPKLDRLTLQLARAEVQNWRGFLFEQDRRVEEAKTALEDAQKCLEALPEADRVRPECQLLLAEVHRNLGINRDGQNHPEEALEHYQTALDLRLGLRSALSGERKYRMYLALSYGYKGDVQLELGREEAAKESYQDAKELRGQLVQEDPTDAVARCLHARDYGNESGLHDLMGDLEPAIRQARERLGVYAPLSDPLLPGDYVNERAQARLTVAELELDRERPADDVPDLLEKAEAEYQNILKAIRQFPGKDQEPPFVKAGLAGIAVARAKYHGLRGEGPEAKGYLTKAEELLRQLRQDGAANPDDLYRLALVRALRSQLPGTDAWERAGDEMLALDRLDDALRVGFKHLKRLQRDRGFAALREARRDEFQPLVDNIVDWRRTHGWPADPPREGPP